MFHGTKLLKILGCAVFFTFLVHVAGFSVRQVATNSTIPFAPQLIIDAGHGGFDGGAVGLSDVIEKDINLKIALKLEALAQLQGFETIMIRNEDVAVYDKNAKDGKSKKVSDIHNRLLMTQNHPNAIFISIHQNKYPQPQPWGTQVFYGPKHPESEKLAQVLQSEIKQALQPENHREIKRAASNLYILTRADNIAVMVECGFLSNADECEKLQEDLYQQQLAQGILRGLLHYLSAPDNNINESAPHLK